MRRVRLGRALLGRALAGEWVGEGPVALTIDPPAQAKFWIKSVPLRSLWVSVTDPDALIAACRGRSANPAAGG